MAEAAKLGRWSLLAERRLWFMAAFGFVAGLPLPLSGFTLRQWLTEGHVSLGAIGLTANIGLAYTLKFLWSPLLDQVRPPLGLHRFGRRRGWLLAIQPLLVLSCVWLALSDAGAAPELAIAAAAVIAFCSASQDVVVDAWRIETFPAHLQPAGMATYVWGYRVALLISGAGVIKSADLIGWHSALLIVAALLAGGVALTLAAPEPPLRLVPPVLKSFTARVVAGVVEPLREFIGRPGSGLVLSYILLFYLGEVMAGVMLAPFYNYLGFDRSAVAAATGPYSLVATILGIAGGVWLIARIGLARALISTGFLQMIAMGMYVWLAYSAGDHVVLYATVIVEAFVQGLASASFVTYLSGLCAAAYTATHYALLSSLASVASHTVGGLSGFVAQALGWKLFYVFSMLASLPAMGVMLMLLRRFPPRPAQMVAAPAE